MALRAFAHPTFFLVPRNDGERIKSPAELIENNSDRRELYFGSG
jgi:hypothetical protein